MTGTSFLELAVLTMLAYLIGGLPFGYWFVRLRLGKDIRTMGSGNIGATNVHRTAGGKAGAIVLVLDVLKGLLAVFIASATTHGNAWAVALSAAAVLVGHCFPVFLNFKGGKAVACFVGAFGFISPVTLLIVLAIFVLTVSLTRYISLGSIVGAGLFPILLWYVAQPAPPLLYASIFAAVLVIYRHRANIVRLRSGSEHTFSLRRKAV